MASDANKPDILTPTGTPGGSERAIGNADWRWQGTSVTGEKTAASGIRTRQNQFATIEEFASWRRSKGMPELTFCALAWAFASYRGEAPGEKSVLVPVSEHR